MISGILGQFGISANNKHTLLLSSLVLKVASLQCAKFIPRLCRSLGIGCYSMFYKLFFFRNACASNVDKASQNLKCKILRHRHEKLRAISDGIFRLNKTFLS